MLRYRWILFWSIDISAIPCRFSLIACGLIVFVVGGALGHSHPDVYCAYNPEGGSAVKITVTNPGLNDVIPSYCDGTSCYSCESVMGANDTFYLNLNVTDSLSGILFTYHSSAPLNYHSIVSVPAANVSASSSTRELTVPYPSNDTIFCDSASDCPQSTPCDSSTHVCSDPNPPPPPSPPPQPVPKPIPTPPATACNMSGVWNLDGRGLRGLQHVDPVLNLTQTSSSGGTWWCDGHLRECPGGGNPSNGTFTLSSSSNGVVFTSYNHSVVNGVVNGTDVCNLITFTDTFYAGAGMSKEPDGPPEQLNLDVTVATFLGDAESKFAGTGMDLTASGQEVIVVGNGASTLGASVHAILGANSSSNGTLFVLDSASAKATGVYRVGDRVDHVRVGKYVVVVGSFGVAALDVSGSTVQVQWNDSLEDIRGGDCGLCCDGDNRCRVATNDDGLVAILVPVGDSYWGGLTFDATGKRLGSTLRKESQVTDVGILNVLNSPAVSFTWLYDSNTGREPMVMPGMDANDETLTKRLFRDWPWDAHPYRQPGPCNGDVADSRAVRVRQSANGKDILFVGRSDGGNGAFYCDSRNVNLSVPTISYDDYTSPYNMQAQAISYVARMDGSTGQTMYGQYNLVRLSNTGGNTLFTMGIADDEAGWFYLLQDAACCIPNMGNLTINHKPLAQNSDASVLQVLAPDMLSRSHWTHFSSPTNAGTQASVDIAVKNNLAALLINSKGDMVTVNPLSNTGPTKDNTFQAYLVIVPTSNLHP